MEYTIENLRLKLMDCIGSDITSKELGDWAYEAWHHFDEAKSGSKKFMEILLEISSEWGMLFTTEDDAKFPKEFLKRRLSEIEDFMNIEKEEEFGL